MRFRMDCAAAYAEVGDYRRAIHEYTDISRAAALPFKIEALCRRAEIEIAMGKDLAATTTVSATETLLTGSETDMTYRVASVSLAHLKLAQAKLAWLKGDPNLSMNALDLARSTLESTLEGGDEWFRELYVSVLIESARSAEVSGQFTNGFAIGDRAEAILSSIREPSLHRRVDLMIAQVALKTASLRPGAVATMPEQLKKLSKALELARACGSLRRVVEIETLLASYSYLMSFPSSNSDWEYLETTRRVLAMAYRLGNQDLIASTLYEFANGLLGTPFWKMGRSMLESAGRGLHESSVPWVYFMNLRSQYQLKSGEIRPALDSAAAAASSARKLLNPRLVVTTLRSLATAAYVVGRRAEATDYIDSLLPLARQHGGIVSCIRAYRSAATITGKRRYAQTAERLQRTLSPKVDFPPS
jgi:tetratricopeptide (TPR) repeat protein